MMEHRFRKRPVEIEAYQMTADRRDDAFGWPAWLRAAWAKPDDESGSLVALAGALLLVTLEGVMAVGRDDWIIRGVKGELYACRADIFALTYEAVE